MAAPSAMFGTSGGLPAHQEPPPPPLPLSHPFTSPPPLVLPSSPSSAIGLPNGGSAHHQLIPGPFLHFHQDPTLGLDFAAQNALIGGQFPPFGFAGLPPPDEQFILQNPQPPPTTTTTTALFFPQHQQSPGDQLLLMGIDPIHHHQMQSNLLIPTTDQLDHHHHHPQQQQQLLLHQFSQQNGCTNSSLPMESISTSFPSIGQEGVPRAGNPLGTSRPTTIGNRRQTQQSRTPRRRGNRLGGINGKNSRPNGDQQKGNHPAAMTTLLEVGHQKMELDEELLIPPNAIIVNGPVDVPPPPQPPSDPAVASSLLLPIGSPNGFAPVPNGEPIRCAQCGEEIREKQMLLLGPKKTPTNGVPTIPSVPIVDDQKQPPQEQQQQFFHCHECLKCSECDELLEMAPKCFVRNGLVFCAQCYAKRFVVFCAMCEKQIEPAVWIRRARDWIYHLVCFKCEHCQRQLGTGEQFALDDTTQRQSQVLGANIPRLLCKQHYMELVRGEQCSPKPKAKRVRTTFGEEQLAILQEHFKVDSNPDGADLERIAQLTGLTKRVTQVWFQNSRARQKKYSGTGPNHHHRKLGPCSSSNSNSSTAGAGGQYRSSTGTPASSVGGCPGGQSPSALFGFGANNDDSEEEEEAEEEGGGGEGARQQQQLMLFDGGGAHSPSPSRLLHTEKMEGPKAIRN